MDEARGFVVVDHRNADEARLAHAVGRRDVPRLLALALALAEQVARSGRGARLESLFLDEGFGTLDAATLDVVAGAMEDLGVEGRMVGLVVMCPSWPSGCRSASRCAASLARRRSSGWTSEVRGRDMGPGVRLAGEGGVLAETDVVVDLGVERPAAAWSPITPPPLAADGDRPVLFVDGVRRIEARVWLGEDGAEVRPGICASYAAGVVRWTGARVVTAEVSRALFCRCAGDGDRHPLRSSRCAPHPPTTRTPCHWPSKAPWATSSSR